MKQKKKLLRCGIKGDRTLIWLLERRINLKNKAIFIQEYKSSWDKTNHINECYCRHAIEKKYAFSSEWQCRIRIPHFQGCIFSIPDEKKCALV